MSTCIPDFIYIGIPHGFSGFFGTGPIGEFGINLDREGADEFFFRIQGAGSLAFIDFDGDGSFTPFVDIPIHWNPTENRFEIEMLDGGFGLCPGYYYVRFIPGLLELPAGVPYWDIYVDFVGGSETVRRSKLMLMDTCILPHMGFGPGGGGILGTDQVFYNATPFPNTVVYQYFNQDGTPADVILNGVTASTHTTTLAPHTTKREFPTVPDPTKIIWALCYGTSPVVCALDFRTAAAGSSSSGSEKNSLQDSNGLLGEAGIADADLDTTHLLNVIKKSNPNLDLAIDTALAVVNPTSAEATINFTLLDKDDVEVSKGQLVLPSKNQQALFFSTLFEGFNEADFTGTLIAKSTGTDFAILTLQTDGKGFQQASLPSVVPGMD